MRIAIAERLKPFSHTPGTHFVLPGSSLRIQVFPTLIRIHDLSENEPKILAEIKLDLLGPLTDFTIMQDLEKGSIQVWGRTKTGYIRYRITAVSEIPNQFAIYLEKIPENGLQLTIDSVQGYSFYRNGNPNQQIQCNSVKETILIAKQSEGGMLYAPTITERLSFGSHKAQDWELIARRQDLSEILPIWFRLGQLVPKHNGIFAEGTLSLLERCRQLIFQRELLEILPAFRDLFLAGFDRALSPRIEDNQYQGFQLPSVSSGNHTSPLILLTEGTALIRSLLVQNKNDGVSILPVLPPEFHCGRLLSTSCKLGKLDLEWSKHMIRRMILIGESEGTLTFHFQKGIKQFRLRQGNADKGTIKITPANIAIQPGSTYFFDHFER